MTSFLYLRMSFFIFGGGNVKLKTKRLLIRDYDIKNLEEYHNLKTKENLCYFAGIKPHLDMDTSLHKLKSAIYNKDYYAVILKENGKLIGDINLYKDPIRKNDTAYQIGFILDDNYWHNGYMHEALEEFIKYVFTYTKIDILTCTVMPFNIKSINTIERLNFKYDGVIRHYKKLYTNEMVDCMIYTITKSEFERNDLNERTNS